MLWTTGARQGLVQTLADKKKEGTVSMLPSVFCAVYCWVNGGSRITYKVHCRQRLVALQVLILIKVRTIIKFVVSQSVREC